LRISESRELVSIAGLGQDRDQRPALSEAQISLIKRAAAIECQLEEQEGRLSQGEQVDLDKFGRAALHLRRILESLGLERKQKVINADQMADDVQQLLSYFGNEANEASP
jgi:hypothetical protein